MSSTRSRHSPGPVWHARKAACAFVPSAVHAGQVCAGAAWRVASQSVTLCILKRVCVPQSPHRIASRGEKKKDGRENEQQHHNSRHGGDAKSAQQAHYSTPEFSPSQATRQCSARYIKRRHCMAPPTSTRN